MADSYPIDEAQIVSLFMACVAYGVYLVTLGMTIHALFWDKYGTKKRYNWVLVAVVALMFVFATFDVAFGLRHNLDAFIFYKGPGGAVAEFEEISNWVNVMKTVDIEVMTLIGDAMLIYRCFIVFFRQWKIIVIPVLLWLANLACCIVIVYITVTLKTSTLISFNGLLNPFLLAFLAITVVTNVLTTGLIVWRIWLPRLSNIIRVVIESGLLYTTLALITFAVHLAGSNALYDVADTMVISVGISFNLIIIRVNQGIAYGESFVETMSLSFRSGSRQPRAATNVGDVISHDVNYGLVTVDNPGDAVSVTSGGASTTQKRWPKDSIV